MVSTALAKLIVIEPSALTIDEPPDAIEITSSTELKSLITTPMPSLIMNVSLPAPPVNVA